MEVGQMDPITLIATALAVGATGGLRDSASSAVRDAYSGLKAQVRDKLRGRPDVDAVLARHEDALGSWRALLEAELLEAGADHDPSLTQAAQALMRLADAAGTRAGKYAVDARGAQGLQIGNDNRQENVFRAGRGD